MIGSALEITVSKPMHQAASNQPIEETLMALARDVKAVRQQETPKVAQVQELAERIFEASMSADKRLAQLGQERERLTRSIDAIWQNYEATVLPLWKVEEELVPVYDELAETSQALDRLSLSSSDESRDRQVQDCQRRLNDLENRIVVDGKFVPSGWSKEGGSKIPTGQAILAQMLHRCYKKAHVLLEATDVTIDASLIPYQNQLEHIISELSMLRHAPELGLDINPYELLQYQEELDHLDSLAKNGKFYDERGGIPRGQAQIRLLLERAYDLVNECLSYMEANEGKRVDPLEMIQKMGERLLDAQDALWTFTKTSGDQLYSLSRSKLGIINRTLSDGADMIKRLLDEPKRGMDQAASKVAALSRSGLSVLTRLYAEFEPVDESLKVIKSRLDEIRSQLLDMRNSFNKTRSKGLLESQSRMSTELRSRYGRELESMRSALDDIDRGRVDGQFVKSPGQPVKSGQDHLKSLLNECYCLVFELQDRLSAE